MKKPLLTFEYTPLKTGPKRVAVFVFSCLLMVSIGFLEYLSGHELSLSIFHLVPISIAVLFVGRAAGLAMSVAAALIWFFADLLSGQQHSSLVIPVFNKLVRLGYFLLHTVLLSKIIQLYQAARNLSLVDPLTGIGNWRLFQEIFHREMEKAKRSRLPISLVYVDLDNFKVMNDTYGHSAGDDLLKLFARTVSSLIRPADVMSRLGGDEFALLLPETDLDGARSIVERIQFELLKILGEKKWPVTLSIGVIIYREYDLSIEEMVQRADALMYRVKNSGKNNAEYLVYGGEGDR